jgi:hypothetical protein
VNGSPSKGNQEFINICQTSVLQAFNTNCRLANPTKSASTKQGNDWYLHTFDLSKTTLDDIGMILVPSSVPILANFLLEAKTRLIFLYFSGCEIARISRISSVKVGFRFLIHRH